MIFIEPTRYGTGITLWGDPFDLDHIRDTIYACADETIWGEPVAFYLLALAYDIRHACQGDRLEKQFGMDEEDTVTYRGVRILWPYFLVQLGFLRKAAGYIPTTKAQQADIYRLEYETENALITYDASVGQKCVDLISIAGDLNPDYLTAFISVRTREFLSEAKPGKARFRKLPALLKNLHSSSSQYHQFKTHLQMIADEQGCEPFQLADQGEWPEFKW